jgi:hypothetical protein
MGALASVPAEQGGRSTRTSSGGARASGRTELDGHSRDESDGDGLGRGRRAAIEGEVAGAVEFDFLLGFLGRPEDTEVWGHIAVGPRTHCSPHHRMLSYAKKREFKERVGDDAGNICYHNPARTTSSLGCRTIFRPNGEGRYRVPRECEQVQ